MEESKFWEIIDRVSDKAHGEMENKCQLIKSEIVALPKAEAVEFYQIFGKMMTQAYTWPLWGAAYVINGGCSDDTFSDFRSSLISRGQKAYQRAILDPDSLADEDFDEDAWFYEGYHYAISHAVRHHIGNVPKLDTPQPHTPSGNRWSEVDVRGCYPQLAAKFA